MAENKPPLAALASGLRNKKPKLDDKTRKAQERKSNADRQARHREKLRQQKSEFIPGEACVVPIRFSEVDSAHIGKAMHIRAIWYGADYTLQEYINLLLLHDADRLNKELKALQETPCACCGKVAPENCGGTFKGQADCWLTRGPLELKV